MPFTSSLRLTIARRSRGTFVAQFLSPRARARQAQQRPRLAGRSANFRRARQVCKDSPLEGSGLIGERQSHPIRGFNRRWIGLTRRLQPSIESRLKRIYAADAPRRNQVGRGGRHDPFAIGRTGLPSAYLNRPTRILRTSVLGETPNA
jgi:hypothetical protein